MPSFQLSWHLPFKLEAAQLLLPPSRCKEATGFPNFAKPSLNGKIASCAEWLVTMKGPKSKCWLEEAVQTRCLNSLRGRPHDENHGLPHATWKTRYHRLRPGSSLPTILFPHPDCATCRHAWMVPWGPAPSACFAVVAAVTGANWANIIPSSSRQLPLKPAKKSLIKDIVIISYVVEKVYLN